MENVTNGTGILPLPSSGHWRPWEVLTLLLSILGIVGNGIVILILYRPCRKGYSTDTLIATLAIADFLTSCFMPLRLVNIQLHKDSAVADIYCKVVTSNLFMWVAIYASIYTLTCISVERFLAVRYPIIVKYFFTATRTKLLCSALWIIPLIMKLSSSLFIYHPSTNGGCERRFYDDKVQRFYGIFVFVVQYLFPVTVMLTAHILTIRNLRWHRRSSAVSRHGSHNPRIRDLMLLRARRRVIHMLFLVVVTFIICWTPDHVNFLLINIGVLEESALQSSIHESFVTLAFVNSCANPFIYSARNAKFRKALRQLFSVSRSNDFKVVFSDGNGTFKHRILSDNTEEMNKV